MIRVCYGCNIIMGEKEPFEDRSETHGLCPECFIGELDKINKMKNERRLEPMENMGPLSEIESAIMNVLTNHKGRYNAIPRVRLVAAVSNSYNDSIDRDRDVRRTLEHLTEQHYEWIGSGPTGYFMIDTEEDRKSVADYYKSYAFSLLHRAARVERSSLLTLLGQLTLKLENQISEVRSQKTERQKSEVRGQMSVSDL